MSGETSPSKDDLQAALLELVDELGHVPTKDEMESQGAYSPYFYACEWGSWNEALEAAELEVNQKTIQSNEECHQELRRVADEIGHTPSRREFNEASSYSAETIRLRHLGWVHACYEAELDLSEVNAPPRDHLAEVLQILAIELGREPTPEDMDEHGPYPSSLYERAFGTWGQAVFYAGVHEGSAIYDDHLVESGVEGGELA